MKIIKIETLISRGSFAKTKFWANARKAICTAILAVDHPIGSGKFTIFPESGKKRGKGNGVKPIKDLFVKKLVKSGWKSEEPLKIASEAKPGKLDAVLYGKAGTIAVEWETGNISSSHRALNKMVLGLMKGLIQAGILIVPSRKLYKFLTDRIGNFTELEPYLDVWKALTIGDGVLEIIVIEHDAESESVPRIKKGTDGRALI
ncbi:MAG: hypothetical protein HQM08_27665 [Candidatus Riflebacteria bacterium]|nr:hypothetical protein [Candidatus Riflebacteria bacterium]